MKNRMMIAITVLFLGGNIAAERRDSGVAYEENDAHLKLDEISDFALDQAFKENLVKELMRRHGLDRKAAEKIANIRTCE